ncbi:MAG: hypothetical protein FJW30_16060 [Acidobacteria bacterium]|nr:hypothetical protein [Acidobacteriota bacterium]
MRSTIMSYLIALAAAAGAHGQRTPEGKPDFSGLYDIASLTPLLRPTQFGTRLEMTDAEAEAVVRKMTATVDADNRASDPERKAPTAGGDVGSYNQLWFDRGVQAARIGGKWRASIITDPPDGRLPELTQQGKAIAARNTLRNRTTGAAFWLAENMNPGPFDDPELRPLTERCLGTFGTSAGPPMLPTGYNNLKQIVQTKDRILILNEMIHDVRVVRMNAEHDPPDIRRWFGDSVGRWEGDTLVVDTTNFNDTPGLVSASRNLHVVERFTRLDANTLSYKFTVEDPSVWVKPWSGETVWPRTTQRLFEYACHEGNYSFTGILKGARILEAEELTKSPK